MSNDLRGQFIANTFQNLVQMPDVSKQNFYNGIGATISVINKDGIGTIKMFYPPSGNISDYFDNNGDGIVGGEWEGWKICLGSSNGTPDLRGRFIVGYDPTGSSGFTYIIGATGGQKEMPQHTHSTSRLFTQGSPSALGALGPSDLYAQPSGWLTNSPTIHNNTINGTLGDAGTGIFPNENRPPFYTLSYVIRVA